MRRVVRSKTYDAQLKRLLEFGAAKYGMKVAEAKLALLDCTLEHFLAVYPSTKRVHPVLGLRVYPIARTPFVVLYDFDDQQLRVHFIFLAGAPLDNFDPKSAVW